MKIELESVKEDKMYVDSNKAQLEQIDSDLKQNNQIMVESLDNLNDELAMMKTMLEEIKSSSQDSTIMNHLNAKVWTMIFILITIIRATFSDFYWFYCMSEHTNGCG